MTGPLRRATNPSFAEVAKRAWISLPRVSQIQSDIEKGRLTEPLKSWVESYKVKA